jgi:hypothetical protein
MLNAAIWPQRCTAISAQFSRGQRAPATKIKPTLPSRERRYLSLRRDLTKVRVDRLFELFDDLQGTAGARAIFNMTFVGPGACVPNAVSFFQDKIECVIVLVCI